MEELNNVFKFLLFVLSIAANASIPVLPSLPLIVFNYINNNFLFAFISTITRSALASYLQYVFADRIYNYNQIKILNRIKIFIKKKIGKGENSLNKLDRIIRNSSFLDFFVLRLSSLISFKATNLYCGLIKYPLRKFLLVTIISQIPWNILYYLSVKSKNLVINDTSKIVSSDLNIYLFGLPIINYIYSLSFLYLISRIIIYLFKKYYKFRI